MQVFVFDLVPYAKHFDKLIDHGRLPFPMTKQHFEPQVAVRTYREHLDAWVELERLGYDGVAFNEHHATPYGLMNSPNLLAASVAQRTEKLKLLMYGNLLPLHDPLRLAEEIAMLDCLSNGRIICGVARGAPREYRILNIPLDESRARFDEVYEVMHRAWTEESFSFDGKFYQYKNIACWPRPVQQPQPQVWIPITSSRDSIEWAAANDACITPGMPGPAREDTIRYYSQCLAKRGKKVTPGHLNIMVEAYVADSKQQAIDEYAPYALYFHTLFNYDHVPMSTVGGYFQKGATDHLRTELRTTAHDDSARLRETTMQDILQQAEMNAWGTPDYVADKIIAEAEAAGAGTVLVNMNRGALPQELFLKQIRRFGTEVLPRLQRHAIKTVPFADAAATA